MLIQLLGDLKGDYSTTVLSRDEFAPFKQNSNPGGRPAWR